MNKISKRDSGSRRVQFHSKSLDNPVEQSHANAVDINTIMRKYRKTGLLPEPVLPGVYGDFSDAEDFHTVQDKVIKAQAMFQALPSDIRTTFKNDPGLLLSFVNDPDNRVEAQKMGLIPPDDPKPAKKAETALPATKEEAGSDASAASGDPESE